MNSPKTTVQWHDVGGEAHAFENGGPLSVCLVARKPACSRVVDGASGCLTCKRHLDPFRAPRGPVGRAFREMFPERWADSDGWVWTCRFIDADMRRTSLPPEQIKREKQELLGDLLTCIVEDDGAEVRDRFVKLVRDYSGEGMLP